MEIEVKNISGQLMNTTTIDPSIWNVEYNADLLHQAIYIYLANVRQWNSSTKSRSQVKYANQKIRNQKGSGRARVGSRRSPIMVGGGVAHGPHPKNIRKSLNKKMKQKALKISLSDKYKNSDEKKISFFEFGILLYKFFHNELLKEIIWNDIIFTY